MVPDTRYLVVPITRLADLPQRNIASMDPEVSSIKVMRSSLSIDIPDSESSATLTERYPKSKIRNIKHVMSLDTGSCERMQT